MEDYKFGSKVKIKHLKSNDAAYLCNAKAKRAFHEDKIGIITKCGHHAPTTYVVLFECGCKVYYEHNELILVLGE